MSCIVCGHKSSHYKSCPIIAKLVRDRVALDIQKVVLSLNRG